MPRMSLYSIRPMVINSMMAAETEFSHVHLLVTNKVCQWKTQTELPTLVCQSQVNP